MDLLPFRCCVTAQTEVKERKPEKRNTDGRKILGFFSGAGTSNFNDILERIISPELSLMSLVKYELLLK